MQVTVDHLKTITQIVNYKQGNSISESRNGHLTHQLLFITIVSSLDHHQVGKKSNCKRLKFTLKEKCLGNSLKKQLNIPIYLERKIPTY